MSMRNKYIGKVEKALAGASSAELVEVNRYVVNLIKMKDGLEVRKFSKGQKVKVRMRGGVEVPATITKVNRKRLQIRIDDAKDAAMFGRGNPYWLVYPSAIV